MPVYIVYCILLSWYSRNYDNYPSKRACRREAPKIFEHFSLVVCRSPEGHIMIEITTSVCFFDLQAHLPSRSGGQMYLWWQLPLQPRSCGKSFSYATDPTSCACYTRPSSIEGEVLFLREFAKICQNRIDWPTGCSLKLLAFFVCVMSCEYVMFSAKLKIKMNLTNMVCMFAIQSQSWWCLSHLFFLFWFFSWWQACLWTEMTGVQRDSLVNECPVLTSAGSQLRREQWHLNFSAVAAWTSMTIRPIKTFTFRVINSLLCRYDSTMIGTFHCRWWKSFLKGL